MDNQFVLSACRFHTKEKDKILVIGHFLEDLIGKNVLSVQMNMEKLPFELEEKRRVLGGKLTRTGAPVTREYFLWISLPQNWREYQTLKIFNSNGTETQDDIKISVRDLIKSEKNLPYHVDQSELSKDGFVITGWYVNDGHTTMQIFDVAGKEMDVTLKQRKRNDVVHAFPENLPEEIVGFEAQYKGEVPKKVTIQFKNDAGQEDCTVKLIFSPIESYYRKAKEWYRKGKIYYQQFGVKATILRTIDKLTGRDSITYESWRKRNCPTEAALSAQRKHEFEYHPKISIVIPLYKTPKPYLDELIDSIKSQTYSNWELCLSDGSGEDSPLKDILQKYEKEDERIRVVYNSNPLQISENTNEALKIISGDYVAFADHDDLLAPDALYECVYALNEDNSIEMIYTDEDKIDMSGKEHFMPHFKSDFNLDMLRSTNYFCHLVVVKKEVVLKAGFLNPEFDGAQDFDFVLRCTENTTKIKHIAKILYHWRAHKDSTAENPESKDYAFEAGARAVQAHYDRLGIKATVEETQHKGIYRTRYELQSLPLISIIIANKDHSQDLKQCISSIESKSSYRNYEIIIVENNSTEKETFEYYEELERECKRARVVYWEGKGFNYPSINNYGATFANGNYLLFLNNDTEVVNKDWLEELLGYCMRPDVGAVGARLYYEDGTIQHAGVVVGLGGVGGHAFAGCSHEDPGYFGRIHMAQDYSAVTAACIMIKKSVFDEVQGFDEKYAVAFNDVDLCLKIRKAGYLIVYNPYVELNHYESKSRGYEDSDEKVERFVSEITLFRTRWEEFLAKGDPYYNPNLTLDQNDFRLAVMKKQNL